ncbi:MAG: response regulator [Peptococcaceae bacterium]
MNILVVTCDKNCKKNITNFLKELGHHVEKCDNGYDALKYLYNSKYNAVIADSKLPGMPGVEFLRILRTFSLQEDVEVIFLMESYDLEYAIQVLKAGAWDCLLKPVNTTKLLNILERISESQRIREIEKELIRVMIFNDSSLIGEGAQAVCKNSDFLDFTGQVTTLNECFSLIKKKKLMF